jgi:DNA-binding SARP family transcriptional activator
MGTLRIHLFGSAGLQSNDGALPPFPTHKSRQLFSYLALNRDRPHTREVLIGALWGDRPEGLARKGFRTELWRLRTLLAAGESECETLLTVRGHTVGFNTESNYWLDVEEFECRISQVRAPAGACISTAEARLLREAVDLYRSDLLDDVYDEWCLNERTRLRHMYIGALEQLLHHHQIQQEWDAAIEIGLRLLRVDPLAEHIHRELMRCYAMQGNRPAALRQYRDCITVLRQELDLDPMDETTMLHRTIRSNGRPMQEPPRTDPETAAALERAAALLSQVTTMLGQLHRVTQQLEDTKSRLQSAVGGAGSARAEPPKTHL